MAFHRHALSFTLTACALAFSAGTASAQAAAPARCPAILQHEFPRLQDGAPQSLCQFTGQVVLVVNTASLCGFTRQYEGLEALYSRYQSRGLVVLGFPSNDFGRQEPGDARQIAEVCFNTFGVKFPMFEKTVTTGPQRHPLYRQLAEATGQPPRWNFHKYLIGRDGQVLRDFPSAIEPMSAAVVSAVEAALKEPRP
ncbi:MAG: glutathione peroxidase [Burkholderiales bacterium]|nr:MAG: glutathione peroxidase [Burkholderiales bacterium]